MTDPVIMTGIVILSAVAFDFVNGFHDAANSIATIVATKVLKPFHAVLWASFFNFAALFLFSTGVAKTVGSGMINLDSVTPYVIFAGLMGAVAWGVLTWLLGMPTSSSHALIGGYAGAAMCNSAMLHGVPAFFAPIVVEGWSKTLMFIVVAPILGFALGGLLMAAFTKFSENGFLKRHQKIYASMQLFSSAFLSLMHGSNDAQKTAGIVAGVLVTAGYFHSFTLPTWVLVLSYSTMACGTMFGGWRIVRTMGHDLTRLKPQGGFCAESAAAMSILLATLLNLPVSTTHATTGSILGVGTARNARGVRWKLAGNILWAWLTTIPAAALLGAFFMALIVKTGLSAISF